MMTVTTTYNALNVLLLTLSVSSYTLLREVVFYSTGIKKDGSIKQYLLDFITLVLPILVNFTLGAAYHGRINCLLIALLIIYLGFKFRWREMELYPAWSSTYPFTKNKSCVTAFRSYVTLCTVTAILGIDFFHVFPRDFAKSKYWGYSLMDTGVGSFVFMAGLVAPEARDPGILSHKKKLLKKALLTSTVLVTIGLIRLGSMSALGFHQSEYEYGKHWNFFFTLASVKMLSSLILSLPTPHSISLVQYSWALSAGIGGLYQIFLNHSITDYLRHFSKDENDNFMDANRFGIYSSIGMVSLYFAGCAYGHQVFKKRETLWEQFRLLLCIVCSSAVLWIAMLVANSNIEMASRCFGNITYILWATAHNSALLASNFLLEFIAVLVNKQLEDPWIPGCCKSCYYKDKSRARCCCLLSAIAANQLLFFVIGNLLTGLINALLKTRKIHTVPAMSALTVYLLACTGIVCLMMARRWSIKFW